MSIESVEETEGFLPHPIGNSTTLSLFMELGIHNYTQYVLYACDSHGNCSTLDPSPGAGYSKQHVVVSYRKIESKNRQFNMSGKEVPTNKKGLAIQQYVIPLEKLTSANCIYLPKLELCIGFNEKWLYEFHPKLHQNIQRNIQTVNKIYRDGIESAPIKIIANDPYGRIQRLFINWGQHVVSVGVSNEIHQQMFCKVYIGTQPGEYSEYEMDLNKILSMENNDCVTNKGVFCIAPTAQKVYAWLQTKINSKEELFTKADVQKIIDGTEQKSKVTARTLESKIDQLEREISFLKAENKSYVDTINSYNLKDIEAEKRKLNEDKQNFEREKMQHAYEQMKQEREENQQKKDLANINYWTNIAKAATVAVPILIAAGALAKGFVSPAK